MHLRRFLLQVVVVLLAGCAAQATLLTFKFDGTVSSVYDPKEVLQQTVRVDSPFSGTYSFDSTVSDTVSNPNSGSYATLPPFSVSLGSLSLISSNPGYINIADNHSGADKYTVGNSGFTYGGYRIVECFIQFVDPSMQAFSSDDLPLSPPNLSLFGSHVFSIQGNSIDSQSGSFLVQGTVTAITPEPSSLLFGVALVAMLASRRWRPRTTLGLAAFFFAITNELSASPIYHNGESATSQSVPSSQSTSTTLSPPGTEVTRTAFQTSAISSPMTAT